MPQVYSLDDSIAEFFEPLEGVTRQQCDDTARALIGAPVTPCPIQGQFSYAVYAGPEQDKVLQFRSEHLDEETLQLAYCTFGRFVVKNVRHGFVGHPSKLEIFEADRISGMTLIETRMRSFSQTMSLIDSHTWRSNLVTDFATFFAYSWKHPIKLKKQQLEDDRSAIARKLHLLSISLPPRFTKIISRLSKSFNDLYSENYPLVLTHGDLCEMNIIVDAKTGRLNGIIDWIDAKVQPFGLALWGVENTLGYMNGDGWHYLEPHEKLVQLFWDTFEHEVGSGTITPTLRKRIRIAQQVGIALRHGFVWTEGSEPKPIAKDDRDGLRYLDTFLDIGD